MTSMSYECKICGQAMKTIGGLNLHNKVRHPEEDTAVPTTTPPLTVEKKTIVEPKTKVSKVKTVEQTQKEKRELYARVKKAFKQKATGVNNNDGVTKAQLKKIFPEEMETLLVGHNSPAKVHKFLEARYKAIVLTNAAGWSRVTLKGKTTRITWKEGVKPNGKYSVSFPILSKK